MSRSYRERKRVGTWRERGEEGEDSLEGEGREIGKGLS